MMCIKHILIFFLVLPIPAASPIFLFLFSAAAFIAVKPCGYCLSLLAILFLSTSPLSPFLHPSLSSPSVIPSNTNTTTISSSSSSSVPQEQLPLDAPIPGRSWFNLNGGRLSQPSLVGYREMDKALIKAVDEGDKGLGGLTRRFFAFERISTRPPTSTSASSSSATSATVGEQARRSVLDQIAAPYLPISRCSSSAISDGSIWTWRDRPLPKQHVDLSWNGIGMIVDFGWKRSEDGIKYEIEEALGTEWIRPPPSPEREDKGQTNDEEGGGNSEEGTATQDNAVPNAEEEASPLGAAEKSGSGFWTRIPLVGGSW
ncbi:hypothetical protein IAT40_004754 [Kwoniella sp. CBS 6097]